MHQKPPESQAQKRIHNADAKKKILEVGDYTPIPNRLRKAYRKGIVSRGCFDLVCEVIEHAETFHLKEAYLLTIFCDRTSLKKATQEAIARKMVRVEKVRIGRSITNVWHLLDPNGWELSSPLQKQRDEISTLEISTLENSPGENSPVQICTDESIDSPVQICTDESIDSPVQISPVQISPVQICTGITRGISNKRDLNKKKKKNNNKKGATTKVLGSAPHSDSSKPFWMIEIVGEFAKRLGGKFFSFPLIYQLLEKFGEDKSRQLLQIMIDQNCCEDQPLKMMIEWSGSDADLCQNLYEQFK